MRLWELEGGDDGEIGLEFGGGARVLAADDVEGELPPPHPPAAPAPPAAHAPPPAPARLPANGQNRLVDAGLQRALRMIQDDEEDEWDSDDLGDDFSDAEWDDEA